MHPLAVAIRVERTLRDWSPLFQGGSGKRCCERKKHRSFPRSPGTLLRPAPSNRDLGPAVLGPTVVSSPSPPTPAERARVPQSEQPKRPGEATVVVERRFRFTVGRVVVLGGGGN